MNQTKNLKNLFNKIRGGITKRYVTFEQLCSFFGLYPRELEFLLYDILPNRFGPYSFKAFIHIYNYIINE